MNAASLLPLASETPASKKARSKRPRFVYIVYRLEVGRIIKPAYGRVGKVAQRFRAPADCGQATGGLQSAAGVEIPF